MALKVMSSLTSVTRSLDIPALADSNLFETYVTSAINHSCAV